VGQTFNIGNERSTVTILDLAQRVKRLTGCPSEILFRPITYSDVEIRIPNVNKARELLGFEAKVDLDEGLARTIAWYRERHPATMNLDPARVEPVRRTKAIVAVHLFGRPARIEELPAVTLIEDAAGALGARRQGRACGGLGLVGCLSFHPRKIVTTGEGGAVT